VTDWAAWFLDVNALDALVDALDAEPLAAEADWDALVALVDALDAETEAAFAAVCAVVAEPPAFVAAV
jgi:hypothetical protein